MTEEEAENKLGVSYTLQQFSASIIQPQLNKLANNLVTRFEDERRTRSERHFYPYFLIWQSPEKLRELRKPTYLIVNILCPKSFTITAPSGDYTVGEP